jgi:cytoskeletal protein RodZ
MNDEMNNLRAEIERDLTLLDGFDHGTPSEATTARIHLAMRRELKRSQRRRWLTRTAMPLAAAAMIALVALLARPSLWSDTGGASTVQLAGTTIDELAVILSDAWDADESDAQTDSTTVTTTASTANESAVATKDATTAVVQTEAESLDAVIDDTTVLALAADLVL